MTATFIHDYCIAVALRL